MGDGSPGEATPVVVVPRVQYLVLQCCRAALQCTALHCNAALQHCSTRYCWYNNDLCRFNRATVLQLTLLHKCAVKNISVSSAVSPNVLNALSKHCIIKAKCLISFFKRS